MGSSETDEGSLVVGKNNDSSTAVTSSSEALCLPLPDNPTMPHSTFLDWRIVPNFQPGLGTEI